MKSHIKTIAAVLFTLGSFTVSAQQKLSYGFGATLGMSHHEIKSSFEEINNVCLMQEGGSVFFNTGNDVVTMKTFAGFYYSNSSVPHTTHLIQTGGWMDFHPLHLNMKYKSRWSPYIVSGVSLNHQRFHGFYAADENAKRNYSVEIEPYVGKIRQVNFDAGLGIRYNIPFQDQYLRFFAQATKAFTMDEKKSSPLEKTSLESSLAVNIGLAFGFARQ